MKNNIDTEDVKRFVIMKDEGSILNNNKVLDASLQGHFSIKTELPFTPDNCNNAVNIEAGTQIDPQIVNMNIKKEPNLDIPMEHQSSVDNSCSNALKVIIKQETPEKTSNTSTPLTPKDFSPLFFPQSQQNTPTNQLEREDKSFAMYCDISVKQEANEAHIDIKNESTRVDNTAEMIQMENGCTNSGCNSQKRCLHTYRCSKCNLVFTEKQIFATHFKKCRLNQNSPTVPLVKEANLSPHKAYDYEYNSSQNLKLIENVRTNPCLYNMDNEDYNDIQLKDVIWANIACSCGFPSGSFAKAAWKKLKENFRDALTQQNNSHVHQTAMLNKHFKYQKHMEFLLPYLNNTPHNEETVNQTELDHINITIPEEIIEDDDVSVVRQLVSPAKKQKVMPSTSEPLSTVNSNKRNREGRKKVWNNLKETKVRPSTSSQQPLHMFFLSMCETTKNLPPHLQLQVKRRVFQAVIEAEEAAATVSNDHTNNNLPRTSSASREGQYINTTGPLSLDLLTNAIDNSSSSQED